MRKLFLYGMFFALIVGLSLLFSGCKKKDNGPSGELYLYKASYYPMENIAVVARNFKYAGDVSCTVGGSTVPILRSSGNDTVLYACIPSSLNAGSQAVVVTSENKKYTSVITVNAVVSPSNPREYVTNSISSLTQEVTLLKSRLDSTDPGASAELNGLIDSLNQLSTKAANLSEADVKAIANYLTANGGVYNELETLYKEISADPLATYGEQKTTKTTTTAETLDRYTRYMEAVIAHFRQGEILKGFETTLLTALVGTADAVSFLQSFVYARMKKTSTQEKSVVKDIPNMAYFANSYSAGLAYDYAVRAIFGNKPTQISAEVPNNSPLGFKNVKITYRNMQPDDKSSKVPVLARLTSVYASLVDVWNGLSNTYIDFGKIGFSSLKTKDKLMKNMSGISLSVDNSNIRLGAATGSGSDFSTNVSLVDPNGAKNGVVTLSYTDDLEQTTSTTLNLSVKPHDGPITIVGGLAAPVDVFVDQTGSIYVLDSNRVIRLATGTTTWEVVANNALGQHMFVDLSGNIFISKINAGGWTGQITKWTPGNTTGTVILGLTSPTVPYTAPKGLAVDATGNIYYADTENGTIFKRASGAATPSAVAGGNGDGTAPNQLNMPEDIYIDGSGNIYVSEVPDFGVVGGRVSKWAPGASNGIVVAGGNGNGSSANQLHNPSFIDVSAGTVYISDATNHRVQKWSPGATTGVTVAGGNGAGSNMDQLNTPKGICVSGGYIYVVDAVNKRVQRW